MRLESIEIGSFRKLRLVHIDLAEKTTVFVGANNSGKTSAMVALRHFLTDPERLRLTTNDLSACHWPAINEIGRRWLHNNQPLSFYRPASCFVPRQCHR